MMLKKRPIGRDDNLKASLFLNKIRLDNLININSLSYFRNNGGWEP